MGTAEAELPSRGKTIRVEYIGLKPVKYDRIANSGKVWRGQGDIQHVEPKHAVLLCKHKMVWRLAGKEGEKPREIVTPKSAVALDVQAFLGLKFFAMQSQLEDVSKENVIQAEAAEESGKRRPGVLKMLRERMTEDANTNA